MSKLRLNRLLGVFIFCISTLVPGPLSARQVERQSTAPIIHITVPVPAFESSKSTVTISGRRLQTIQLRIFRVEPFELLHALRHPYGAGAEDPLGLHPRDDAGEMQADLFNFVAGRRPVTEVPVHTIPDTTDGFSKSVLLPLDTVGAYILIAEGDDKKTRAATLYFRTDLRIKRRAFRGKRGGFVYEVSDVRTGRVLRGARVFTRDGYATRWGFQLASDRGELPQPQPLDSLPAPEFRYHDASGVTDSRGRWHNPRAPFAGQGKRVSLEAGTPMATGGLQYDYSQTFALSGSHFGIVESDFWGTKRTLGK